MGNCCAGGYNRIFGERVARRDARRYRHKGLDATAQRLVDEVAGLDIQNAEVLEIGGGVGAIELELLKRGAERATNVELSHGYDAEGEKLLAEAGLGGRVVRRYGDFVEDEALVDPADVVVMHRVVCCYPDPDALVGAAAGHARRVLAFSFPRRTWWLRLGARVANVYFRLACNFETFVHPPETILGAAHSRGFAPVHEHTGRVWRLAVLERVS
ncbi:MAG TPA: methyltransferase domain-containing protein [Gaiellaceae bacterium]|nr:methyltransferase domain-containing protein [Gaiellaceae bacterium]